MRVIFLQRYHHVRSGIGKVYEIGHIEDFDGSIEPSLIESGIVEAAPKDLQTICVLKHNSKINMNNNTPL